MSCFDESKLPYYNYKNYGNRCGCYVPPIPNRCDNTHYCPGYPQCPNNWPPKSNCPCPPKPCPPKKEGLIIHFEGTFRLF